jgi:hypothetical protein
MSTTPSKRRSRAEWEQLMASYEASGETQREFCDQHHVAYSSFCCNVTGHSRPLFLSR